MSLKHKLAGPLQRQEKEQLLEEKRDPVAISQLNKDFLNFLSPYLLQPPAKGHPQLPPALCPKREATTLRNLEAHPLLPCYQNTCTVFCNLKCFAQSCGF